MNPLISILLPVRNAEKTLSRALESCLMQSFQDFELVAVDDGSTDGTLDILRDFSLRDPRIAVCGFKEHRGLVAALRLAHAKAKGEFLARMDGDDVCRTDRLREQQSFLKANPEVAVCGCAVKIIDAETGGSARGGYAHYERWLNSLTEPGQLHRERFVESPLAHPTVMMRREAYEAVGGYRDPGWPEDYDLWLRMFEAGFRLASVGRVLYEWNDSPGRLSRTDSRYSQVAFLRAKAHYLSRIGDIQNRGVMISGAGPIGKTLARFLTEFGISVRAFLEVHPRRIGNCISDIPVLGEKDLKMRSASSAVQIAAVGQKGQRARIRDFLVSKGFIEGESFFCAA